MSTGAKPLPHRVGWSHRRMLWLLTGLIVAAGIPVALDRKVFSQGAQAPRPDLRRHRRLRAEACALPRDGRRRAQGGVNFYRGGIAVFGLIFVGIGIALVVVTTIHGGAVFGYLVGALFIGLGLGRLYLLRARR